MDLRYGDRIAIDDPAGDPATTRCDRGSRGPLWPAGQRRRAGDRGLCRAGQGPRGHHPLKARPCRVARTGRTFGLQLQQRHNDGYRLRDQQQPGRHGRRSRASDPRRDGCRRNRDHDLEQGDRHYREKAPTGQGGLTQNATRGRTRELRHECSLEIWFAKWRDPFAAFICDDGALDVLRPVVIEMGWQPEKCDKGGLRNAVQSLSISASPNILMVDLSESGDPLERHQRARRSLRAGHGGDRHRPGQRRAALSRSAGQRHPRLSAQAAVVGPGARCASPGADGVLQPRRRAMALRPSGTSRPR